MLSVKGIGLREESRICASLSRAVRGSGCAGPGDESRAWGIGLSMVTAIGWVSGWEVEGFQERDARGEVVGGWFAEKYGRRR